MRARAFACDGKNDFVFTQSHTVRAAGARTCAARAGQLTGGEQAGSGGGGGEFTGSFLAGDCTLPCGQILSVDPTGLEFPRKGKEKRKKNPQEAD